MLNKTDELFLSMAEYLGVKNVFTEEYQVLPTTGKPGFGDPSKHISSGKILRNRESAPIDGLEAFDFSSLRTEYQQTADIFSSRSHTSVDFL